MTEYTIKDQEAGQSLNKFLHKYLPKAPVSFFYKMYRKKNIVLNGKKVEGKEILVCGDVIKLFLANDTILGFQEDTFLKSGEYERAFKAFPNIQVVYEDHSIVILNKPAGILTQKAKPDDLSLNEWLIGYLLNKNEITVSSLQTFHPSVLNRLDRNTYGLVICSKSLEGAKTISQWIRERKIRKFYQMIVKGTGLQKTTIKGYLCKDHAKNRVFLTDVREDAPDPDCADEIETCYEPLCEYKDMTWVEAELITGKTHQIRAHMASIHHPLLGDYKYGDPTWNDRYRRLGVKSQLLTACRLEFPHAEGNLKQLDHLVVSISLPPIYDKIRKQEIEII